MFRKGRLEIWISNRDPFPPPYREKRRGRRCSVRLNTLHLLEGGRLNPGRAFWERNPETDYNWKQQQQQQKVVKCLCGRQIARPCSAPRQPPAPRGVTPQQPLHVLVKVISFSPEKGSWEGAKEEGPVRRFCLICSGNIPAPAFTVNEFLREPGAWAVPCR